MRRNHKTKYPQGLITCLYGQSLREIILMNVTQVLAMAYPTIILILHFSQQIKPPFIGIGF